MAESYPRLAIDQPAAYRILVQGWISLRWEDWFEGMRIEHLGVEAQSDPSEGEASMPETAEATLLTGCVPDQAALLGMLQRLYSFGLPVIKVEWVPA